MISNNFFFFYFVVGYELKLIKLEGFSFYYFQRPSNDLEIEKH